ncbi:MAG: glycosyltransferase [Oscillospiraceae bacterium]|nr:glycosyltransferase [Oscillospiraceae bacterium]
MDLISVIVPVYNVEKYLDQCVESIVNQTYKNLEIILVDDGSPDRCPAMCDAWAERDSRIKVIHKENGGGGPARNAGFDIAQGTFVGLVDSDDFISPDTYERLLTYMTDDMDIVECEMVKTSNDCASFSASEAEKVVCTAAEAMRLHIMDSLFCQTPPNKLYRRSAIADVRFPAGTGIDDEYWTYRVIGNARKLVHIRSVLYAYRQHEESVMHSLTIPKRLRAIDAKTQRLQYMGIHFPELEPLCRKELYFSCLYHGQLILRNFPPAETGAAIKELGRILRSQYVNYGTAKDRLWLTLGRISFPFTCRLRNRLKIGI